ncbi:MAG: hypothetical protein HQM08_26600 [Candidatus Riflebacteria bacterium]|nr:hypothetical protein [Candidatus Riflebacteria bacterium]
MKYRFKLWAVFFICLLFSPILFANGEKIEKDEWLADRCISDQFAFDIKCWFATLFPPVPVAKSTPEGKKQEEQRKILGRLFLLLKYGGVQMRSGGKDGDTPTGNWEAFPHPLATLLSHGGRVLIGVKKSAKLDPYAITNWIVRGGELTGTTQEKNAVAGFKGRLASTHSTTFTKDVLEEYKKSFLAPNFNNWAMNIPVGGFGNTGANGKAVLPNGGFGHLLFVVDKAPSSSKIWTVGIQIGCENSEPLGFTKALYTEKCHLGTAHSIFGKSDDIHVTGGGRWSQMSLNYPKWAKAHPKDEVPQEFRPGKYDCLRMIISDKSDLKEVLKNENKIDDEKAMKDILSSPPEPPMEEVKLD